MKTFPVYGNCKDEGMDLRDYFAAKALPIVWEMWRSNYELDCQKNSIEFDGWDSEVDYEIVSARAYELADKMMKAREE